MFLTLAQQFVVVKIGYCFWVLSMESSYYSAANLLPITYSRKAWGHPVQCLSRPRSPGRERTQTRTFDMLQTSG